MGLSWLLCPGFCPRCSSPAALAHRPPQSSLALPCHLLHRLLGQDGAVSNPLPRRVSIIFFPGSMAALSTARQVLVLMTLAASSSAKRESSNHLPMGTAHAGDWEMVS